MSDDLSTAPIFAAGAAPKAREFEFGSAENEVFRALAGAMRFVGGASVALAAVMLVSCLAAAALNGMGALPFTIGQAVGAAVSVISGVWLRGAARSVDSIVRTEGSDVSHLMTAMRDLTRMFNLQRTVLVAAFVVGGVAIVLSLLFVFVLMPGRVG